MNILSCFFACIIIAYSYSINASPGLHYQIGTKTVDISKQDLEEVHVFPLSQHTASAMIKLTPPMADHIYHLSEKNIGKNIAWIWNGRVLCTQKIQAPLNGDITIHHFSAFEAEDFRKSIGLPIN